MQVIRENHRYNVRKCSQGSHVADAFMLKLAQRRVRMPGKQGHWADLLFSSWRKSEACSEEELCLLACQEQPAQLMMMVTELRSMIVMIVYKLGLIVI